MHAICFLVVAMVGVDVGWRPAENGDLEYIIQIDPQQARTLKTGDVIEVGVRPQLRSVRQFRIVVGNESLPRQLGGESTPTPPIAVVEPQASSGSPPVAKNNFGTSIVVPPKQSTRDQDDDATHWIAAEKSDPSAAASKGTTIPTVPIHPERLADQTNTGPRYRNLPPPPASEPAPNETDPLGYRYGDSVPIQPPPDAKLNTLPPPPQNASLQIPLPPPPQIVPPPEMPVAQEPDAALPSTASALPVTTVPQDTLPVVPATSLSEPTTEPPEETFSGERLAARTDGASSAAVESAPVKPSVAEGPSASSAKGSSASGNQPTPWLPLTFTLFALFASLGGNLYLGWITWELRNRFRETTKEAS